MHLMHLMYLMHLMKFVHLLPALPAAPCQATRPPSRQTPESARRRSERRLLGTNKRKSRTHTHKSGKQRETGAQQILMGRGGGGRGGREGKRKFNDLLRCIIPVMSLQEQPLFRPKTLQQTLFNARLTRERPGQRPGRVDDDIRADREHGAV